MEILTLIKKCKAPLAVLAVVVLVESGNAVRRATDSNYFNDASFNQQLWNNSNNSLFDDGEGKDNQRAKMVDDIMRRHLKVGMSKDEVEDLLGSPTMRDIEGNDFTYTVGPRYKQNTDSGFLVVIFDNWDKLESAAAGQDESDLFCVGQCR